MNKYQELDAIEYMINITGNLPPDVTIGALYLYLQEERKKLQDSITTKEWFANLVNLQS